MLGDQCLYGLPPLLHCLFKHTHTHTLTHTQRPACLGINVSLNEPVSGGGSGVISRTKSSHWAAEPTRGQQINFHYISIPTILLMREGLVRVRERETKRESKRESVCVCVCGCFLLLKCFMRRDGPVVHVSTFLHLQLQLHSFKPFLIYFLFGIGVSLTQ